MKTLLIFTILFYTIFSNISLYSAAKRKKGEKNIPLTPLSIDRINLKNDLIKTLNGAVDNSITKGGYISVLKDRKTLLEIGNNYDKQTLLPVASLSKSFTALAILKLQEEGKLKLQDKVSTYIPEFGELEDFKGFESLNILNLLQHHSGIPYEGRKSSYQFNFENKDFILPKIVVQPNIKYIYSNYNYRLLGKIIEIASGELARDYIRSRILEPLELEEYSFSESFDCASGFMISPRDLLKYAGIYLQGGVYNGKNILEKNSFKKIFIRPNFEKYNYYGLGWHILTSEKEKRVESLFHSGIGDYNFGQIRIFTKNKYIFFFQTEHTGKNRSEFNKLNRKIEFSLMRYIQLDKKV